MSDVTFKLLNDDDTAKTIAEWFHDSWRDVPPYYSVEQECENLRKFFQDSEKMFPFACVACLDGAPIGIVCVGKREKFLENVGTEAPWIYSMYVHQDMRKHGVGSELLGKLGEILVKQGFRQSFVATRKAEDYYRKNGYTSIGTAQNEAGNYVVLKKDLPVPTLETKDQSDHKQRMRHGLPKP